MSNDRNTPDDPDKDTRFREGRRGLSTSKSATDSSQDTSVGSGTRVQSRKNPESLEFPPFTLSYPASSESTKVVTSEERQASSTDVNALLAGRYRIVRKIGSGGMGNVYLAEHVVLRKMFAIKMLRPRIRSVDCAVQRFLQEAQAASVLHHDNVVAITDFGEDSRGHVFMVMEYLEGETLAKMIESQGAQPWQAARRLVLQVLRALEAAHHRGVIHRDIKPANCLCVRVETEDRLDDIRIKVLDFGVAKVRDGISDQELETQVGVILGTPAYVSPEQIESSNVDCRSDLYSVGVMLFELLTGERPFSGGSAASVAHQHLFKEAKLVNSVLKGSKIPEALEQIVQRSLQKNPALRFQSAAEFIESLNAVGDSEEDGVGRLQSQPAFSDHKKDENEVGQEFSSGASPASQSAGSLLSVGDHESLQLRRLLAKVRRYWINGVLDQVISGPSDLVEQDRTLDFSTVTTPWDGFSRMIAEDERHEPPDKPIADIFEDLNRSLLILGEPGSGKTITLLTLAKILLARAEQRIQVAEPIPVVFSLASWTRSHSDFGEWMIVELRLRYQVPSDLGRRWLRNNLIIPLLDGLDEVRQVDQQICVRAINHYHDQHCFPGIVISSRTDAYLELPERLKVNGALNLHRLNEQQIDQYLALGGERLVALRDCVQRDPSMIEMAKTPMLLNVMCSVYDGAKSIDVQAENSLQQHRSNLFDAYLERAVSRSGKLSHEISVEEIRERLQWLAYRMRSHSLALFQLEDLQPSWIADKKLLNLYALSTRLVCTVLFGASLILSLGNSPLKNLGFQVDLAFGLRFGLLVALIGGLSYGIRACIQFRRTSSPDKYSSSEESELSDLKANGSMPFPVSGRNKYLGVRRLIGQGGFALIIGAIVGTLAGGGEHWITTFMGLEIGMFLAIIFSFRPTNDFVRHDIVIAESLHWSPSSFLQSLIFTVPVVLGLAASAWHIESSETGIILGLIGLGLGALVGGLQRKVVEKRSRPNQGIVAMVRRAILLGAVGAISTIVLVGAEYGWIYASQFALTVAVIVALFYGGRDVIYHQILRQFLAVDRYEAKGLGKFLEVAADLVILRRVGPGYIFLHSSFMDYFIKGDVKN